MMTVTEMIEALKEIEMRGFGEATVRCYTELGGDTYKPVEIEFHPSAENNDNYPLNYDNWVEVK
jgi:hypothetical protein